MIDLLRNKFRKRLHLNYLRSNINILKYEILNDALVGKINKNKVDLFYKYNKRLVSNNFFKINNYFFNKKIWVHRKN